MATNRKIIFILLTCFICVFVIAAYGTYRCNQPQFVDPLTGSFFPSPLNTFLDGWGLLHFFFFTGLVYNFPDHLMLIFLLGITWEVVESTLRDRPFYISTCRSKPVLSSDDSPWWYARWQDIIMNGFGILVGYHLRKFK